MDELRYQYADLGASMIRDVLNQVDQDPEKAGEILRGFTTPSDPSEEEIIRKLQQLHQYAHLGNDVLRKTLREKAWNVEEALVAIVAMQAHTDEEERKIREIEMNVGDLGRETIVQVLKQNHWDLEKTIFSLFKIKEEQDRAAQKQNNLKKERMAPQKREEERKRIEIAQEEQKRMAAQEEQKRLAAQKREEERKRIEIASQEEQKRMAAQEEQKRLAAHKREEERKRIEMEEEKKRIAIEREIEEKKRFALEEKKRRTAEKEFEEQRRIIVDKELREREKRIEKEKEIEEKKRFALEEKKRRTAEKELEEQRRFVLEEQRRLAEEQRRIAAEKESDEQKRQSEARLDQQRIAALEEKLRLFEEEKQKVITRRPPTSLDQGQLNIEASTTDFFLISPESQPKPQDLVVKITAEPDHADYGERITYSWEHSALPTTNDWIGFYREGSSDKEYLSFQWLHPAKSGSFTVAAPATPGTYVFKYFVNKSYVCWAVSSPIRVGAVFNLIPTILSSSEVSIKIEQLFGKPSSTSWIGLFESGKDNRSYVEYYYLEGKQQVSFKIPKSGKWEFRAFHLKGYDHSGSCFVVI